MLSLLGNPSCLLYFLIEFYQPCRPAFLVQETIRKGISHNHWAGWLFLPCVLIAGWLLLVVVHCLHPIVYLYANTSGLHILDVVLIVLLEYYGQVFVLNTQCLKHFHFLLKVHINHPF